MAYRMDDSALLDAFERGDINAEAFGHLDHLRAAFVLLRAYPFLEALNIYSDRLKRITVEAGVPDKYNETITIVFLSLIAEKMADKHQDWTDFIKRNPDLMDASLLTRWYPRERLDSPLAREMFLMPIPAQIGAG